MSESDSVRDSVQRGKRKQVTLDMETGIFLLKLFYEAQHDIEIRCLPSKKQFFVSSPNRDEIGRIVNANIHNQNIYFGCCTRNGGKGTKEACREVVALWLDIDFKDLAGGQAEADKTIESMIPPSVVVSSGNGYHIYWLLREPVEAKPEIIEPYLTGLAQRYNGDPSAAELARILRVPGTFNYKNSGKKPVVIVKDDYDLRYNLSDFDDLKLEYANASKNTSRNDTADIIPEGQRNSTLTSLAGLMRKRGLSELEIAPALHAINLNRCRPPLPDHEINCIAKSIGKYENELSGDHDLIQRFGEPYYLNREGAVTGINEAFYAGLQDKVYTGLYEPDEKAFYRYSPNNGIYAVISEHTIKQEISTQILDISRAKNLPSLERKITNSNLNNVIAHLKGVSEKRGVFNRNRNVIHLHNGMIVHNEGDADFCEFSPEFYSRNQSPISFNPDAKCERFLNELVYPAVTPDDALLLQKYAGMCLSGDNIIQRFLIADGKPGTGKTQLALCIQGIVGRENVSELRTRHLSDRFELYRYLKKTLLVGVDVPGKFLSEKGAYIIKGLVGGDYFDAEQKGGTGSFPVQGNFCILVTSNSRLQVKLDGDIGAWRRRLLIVRYEAPAPKKKIPNFADLLIQQEGSGILNWALQGLGMLLSDIEESGDIKLGQAQIDRVNLLLAESDSLRNFIRDNVMGADHGDLSGAEIVEAYAKFCPSMGWNPKPITAIYSELDGLVLELFGKAKSHDIKRDGRCVRGYRGLCLTKGAADG